jgi:hypothetical protein
MMQFVRYLKCEAGGGIWLQFGDDLSLKDYEERIQEYFSEPRAALLSPARGQLCITISCKHNGFVRACVVRRLSSQAGVQALVQHVDHGTTELVPVVRLFSCPSQFSLDSNPPFANLCFLSGVDISLLTQSKDGEENAEWRTEASQSFLRLIHGHPLSAKVKKTDRNGSCHVMLYILSSNGKDKVCVNSSLQSTLLTCSSDLQQGIMMADSD